MQICHPMGEAWGGALLTQIATTKFACYMQERNFEMYSAMHSIKLITWSTMSKKVPFTICGSDKRKFKSQWSKEDSLKIEARRKEISPNWNASYERTFFGWRFLERKKGLGRWVLFWELRIDQNWSLCIYTSIQRLSKLFCCSCTMALFHGFWSWISNTGWPWSGQVSTHIWKDNEFQWRRTRKPLISTHHFDPLLQVSHHIP